MKLFALILAVSLGLGCTASWLAITWRRLKTTPALTDASRAAAIDGTYTDVGDCRMFHRVHAGPAIAQQNLPVVLVHGLVISSRYMEPLASALGRQFRVLAPDLPGFGESRFIGGDKARTLTLAQLADALHDWLAALGIDRAAFVGNSFGCEILALLACRHPEVVDRLVLQGPTTDPAARTLVAQAWRDLVNGRRERARSPAATGRIDYAKAGLGRAFATMQILIRDRIEERLPHVMAPTLVVGGTRDPVAPPEWAARVARLLPHGSLAMIDRGTHTLNYVYPYTFAQAIAPFLAAAARTSEVVATP
ncbi:alpha/beta fold hydrolase [Paraburkholderia sabiae]|uniref:Alpha/beta fold hydrolase n=1 Tax=Paraburkholderia sabiae TaxID=273251 RepID=A0ABU9QRL5_9BURK|nr:alpha/beta fold hydrolase [Paraburkholderia sabiae]WJZ79321.1 alpha/beta fold hydrolase [Paraburkholderia sabiae]CAD6563050.1 Putative aminoacrylate hydrolase RutD [Paraburkholderia sabiae]